MILLTKKINYVKLFLINKKQIIFFICKIGAKMDKNCENLKFQKYLRDILTSQDVVKGVRENINTLLCVIPEIKDMIGFEHKHPHHHLDVWEHTLFALSLSPNEFTIRLSLLLHDIGKPHSFTQVDEIRHFRGHPQVSSNMSREILIRLGFSKEYTEEICEIVRLHDTPLTEEFIKDKQNLSRKIFEVQKCDAMAHNPEKNAKRIAYIDRISNIFFFFLRYK